jgi:hypothetical protein
MGDLKNVFRIWVGMPDRKRPLERCKDRREDNIVTDIKKHPMTVFLNSSGSGHRTAAGSWEHGNETSIYMKGQGIS